MLSVIELAAQAEAEGRQVTWIKPERKFKTLCALHNQPIFAAQLGLRINIVPCSAGCTLSLEPESVPIATNGASNGDHPPAVEDAQRGYDLADWAGKLLGALERATKSHPELVGPSLSDEQLYDRLLSITETVYPVPAGLSETDVQEELGKVIRRYRENHQLPAVRNGTGPSAVPVIIPWENQSAALVANAAYLARIPVIEKLCFSEGVSMLVGGKHAGKSTLARSAAMCVVKGVPFLERQTLQGPVLYCASDDEAPVARQELLRMGWVDSDAFKFVQYGNIAEQDDPVRILDAIQADISRFGALFVVLDMLFDFVRIADEMSYAVTRKALGEIQHIASVSKAHVMVTHHAPKHMNEMAKAAVAALGSQGLAARVSPIILARHHGETVYSCESTMARDPRGKAIPPLRLGLDSEGRTSVLGPWKDWMQAEVWAPRVLELMESEKGQEYTVKDVMAALELGQALIQRSLALLFKDGKCQRNGTGKRGKPYRYRVGESVQPDIFNHDTME